MNNIHEVIEACAHHIGTSYNQPARGTVSKCPLPDHNDFRASFSVREDYNSFNCFGCGNHGGLLHVPVAFGICRDLSEASYWLAERNLIPPPDSTLGTGNVRSYQSPRVYTNHDDLPDFYRFNRTESLLNIYDEIGPLGLRKVRDYIAELRFARNIKLEPKLKAYTKAIVQGACLDMIADEIGSSNCYSDEVIGHAVIRYSGLFD